MARSTLDTAVYATILVAPLALALGYIAFLPAPEPVVLVEHADCPAPVEPVATAVAVDEPTPAIEIVAEPAAEPIVAAPTAPPAGAGVLMFERRLALSTAPDIAWSKGQLRVHPNEYGITVSKAADPSKLPAALAELAGQRFMVHSADGSACAALVGPMSIYARVDGETGYGDAYHDEELTDQDHDKALREARRDVWEHNAELLLARTDAPKCDGLWARRADLPAPAVFGLRDLAEDAELELEDQVAALLADEPRVLGLRADYTVWFREIDPEARTDYAAWPDFYRSTIEIRRWDEIGGERSFLTVDVGSPGEACSGDFFGHVSFVLAPAADPQPGRAWDVLPAEGFWRPQALMDLDRDGHLEAITAGGTRLETAGSDPALEQGYQIPWYGCPC